MAARFLKSTPVGTPAPSPSRRSPTPEPSRVSDVQEAARQRSISMSEATPRAAAAHRDLPGLDTNRTPAASVRNVFQGGIGDMDRAGSLFGGGVEAGSSKGLGSPGKENSLGVTKTLSQSGSGSGSGRASPSLSNSTQSARPPPSHYAASVSSLQSHQPHRSGSSSGAVPQAIKSLDSFSSKNVAAALVGSGAEAKQIDDVWQTLCIRLLPLFNGEGLKGYVEDLNELVLTHIQRTLARCQTIQKTQSRATPTTDVSSLASGLIISDLSELISIGCLTLTAKLSPAPPAQSLTDEKFLLRLNELWSFFWTGVLPHLEAVFWVLRSDERLRATTSTTGTGSDRAGSRQPSDGTPSLESTMIDARRLALMGFRDHLILPQVERISYLFQDAFDFSSPSSRRSTPSLPPHTPINRLPPPSPNWSPNASSYFPHPASPSGSSTPLPKSSFAPSSTVLAANARRRQMVSILASLLTGDERQSEMDALMRTMRVGSGGGGSGRGRTSPRENHAEHRTKHHPRPMLAEKTKYNSEELEPEGGSNPFIATALPPSSPFHFSSSRPRANTLDSLDEDEASMYNVDTTGGASITPVASARKGKRRGFLPLLGRSKSGSDAPAKPPSGLSSPLFPPDGEYSNSETPKVGRRFGGAPKRHNSMREDSEGTTGSEFEKDGNAR